MCFYTSNEKFEFFFQTVKGFSIWIVIRGIIIFLEYIKVDILVKCPTLLCEKSRCNLQNDTNI